MQHKLQHELNLEMYAQSSSSCPKDQRLMPNFRSTPSNHNPRKRKLISNQYMGCNLKPKETPQTHQCRLFSFWKLMAQEHNIPCQVLNVEALIPKITFCKLLTTGSIIPSISSPCKETPLPADSLSFTSNTYLTQGYLCA
eukprot:TRINITY_DN16344_c6_g1_i1.p1 TRINITY_DN16344_c6_g1~~TRINITY_DN16344_c6_g1_i1.p1  ORF type:complete len:140 (-),score=8.53 TRINITY_DN16344_c6_g1_i1:182-601(-)